jgi:hypothetical protein
MFSAKKTVLGMTNCNNFYTISNSVSGETIALEILKFFRFVFVVEMVSKVVEE